MPEYQTFKWKAQLDVGNRGETLFAKEYPHATKTSGRVDDFIINGEMVELKSDSYSMQNTENFFFEQYGNIQKGKLGGPWRSMEDKITWFVYLFLPEKKFFWFKTEPLVKFLNERIKTLKVKIIKNRGYDTAGFAVNREEVKHLMESPPRSS